MLTEMFINFNGNCRQAVEFYSKVFKSPIGNLMTYKDAPPDPKNPINLSDRDRVMYAGIGMGNMTLMFMDMPVDYPVKIGDNITPTVSVADKSEVARLFNELKEGGIVIQELQQTFYSELYGSVKDKFGIVWQILYYVPQK